MKGKQRGRSPPRFCPLYDLEEKHCSDVHVDGRQKKSDPPPNGHELLVEGRFLCCVGCPCAEERLVINKQDKFVMVHLFQLENLNFEKNKPTKNRKSFQFTFVPFSLETADTLIHKKMFRKN